MELRRIDFRGKSIETNEWLHGDLIHSSDMKRCAILVNDKSSHDECDVNPYTIGQYTGLNDKNDKEIYEGDIVGWKDDNLLYAVIFRKGMFYASVDVEDCNEEIYGGFPLCTLASQGGKGIEIVGNIYDNPELKKKYKEIIEIKNPNNNE